MDFFEGFSRIFYRRKISGVGIKILFYYELFKRFNIFKFMNLVFLECFGERREG